MLRWLAGFGLVLASGALRAETVRLDVTRDTWVCNVGGQAAGNNGGSPRLKTKGNQEFSIIDVDVAALRGRVIRRATLHLHCETPGAAQRRVTVSTLAGRWVEGTASGYAVQPGASSFLWAQTGEVPWAGPGSDITAVCLGNGNTIWGFADATPVDAQGWQSIEVRAEVLAARVAGISHGFVVFDDVGSEYETDGQNFIYRQLPNRHVTSREGRREHRPYMLAELGPADGDPPGAIEAIGDVTPRDAPPGEATVAFRTPADKGPAGVAGFLARWSEQPAGWDASRPVPQYLVPAATVEGREVRMCLRDLPAGPGAVITLHVRAVDRAGNIGQATTTQVALSRAADFVIGPSIARRFDQPAANPRLGDVEVAVVDTLDKVHPISGAMIPPRDARYRQANHLWSAATRTIRLHAARNEFADFQLLLGGRSGGLTAELRFDDPSIKSELFRFRHVNTAAGPLPDPLVPLTGPILIPAADERIGAQNHAALVADVYVPHNTAPGLKTGTLLLRSAGESLSLRVELTVWNLTLPDRLSFLAEMNCYGLPDATAKDYYRLAHAHRATLNRLGYNWRGQVSDGCAPKWDGVAFDWTDYDRRFGPLLDGSAFADLPRKGVPVEAFYLPLNENWPVPIEQGFKGGYWADEALAPEYRRAFVEACAQFAGHINRRKWNDTLFEFYLNNKVYYKKDRWDRCSAPWILDEPAYTQDFWALRWYGQAFHEGVGPHRGAARLVYRCDISRPQWQRDLLDGLLNVNIVGGAVRRYHRLVLDRKHRNGEITIVYGSSNNIDEPNIQPVAWCIDAWCMGLDGVLPWQTVGKDDSWKNGDALSLFYPGGPAGTKGPVPSVRLKAYRRGQQDVEYLAMLAGSRGAPHWAVARAVRDALGLRGQFTQSGEDDAGRMNYDSVDPATLWELRMRVAGMLNHGHAEMKQKVE